jgi:putative ABC transport system permease protein
MLPTILDDTRLALRALSKTPGFALVVILTLAVGIGANTAIFSVVDAVLLRPLPYPDQERIVTIGVDRPETGPGEFGFADVGYRHFLEGQRSFGHFGVYQSASMPLTGVGEPVQLEVGLMTNSAYAALGNQPLLGRLPDDTEDVSGGPLVVVLSHDFWITRFGADPDVVGSTLDLDARTREVIGVMPPEFAFPSDEIDLWVPLQLDPASQNLGMIRYRGVARLSEEATLASASDDADRLMRSLGDVGYGPAWFERNFAGRAYVDTLKEYVVGDLRQTLLIVLGAVSFVLVIACVNVANLFLVRAEARARQSAVRTALGATRSRLIRDTLAETLILAVVGGALGLVLAYVGIHALRALGPTSIPRLAGVGIDRTVFSYTAGVSILVGLVVAIVPAARTNPSRLRHALADGGRGGTVGRDRHLVRGVLVVAEVALALVLLIGSGLMVRTFQELRSVDPGFDSAGVVTFTLTLPPTRYPDGESEARFFEDLLDRVRALPGVQAAGAITTLPMRPGPGYTVGVEDFAVAPGTFPPVAGHAWITPGYLEALGIPILSGRGPERADQHGEPRSLFASAALEDRFWPDGSALGKGIATFGTLGTVDGVVGDVHTYRLDEPPDEMIYLPLNWSRTPTWRPMSVAVRSTGDQADLTGVLRREVARVDPDLPLSDVATMDAVVSDSISRTSFTMFLLTIAAAISLFLGSVGIYGVISYVVTLRTSEFGVRAALGATSPAIVAHVLRRGMMLAGAGVALGLAAASLMGRVLESLLFEVAPTDPVTFVVGSVTFLLVAVAACVVPARRASRVDPVEALWG